MMTAYNISFVEQKPLSSGSGYAVRGKSSALIKHHCVEWLILSESLSFFNLEFLYFVFLVFMHVFKLLKYSLVYEMLILYS